MNPYDAQLPPDNGVGGGMPETVHISISIFIHLVICAQMFTSAQIGLYTSIPPIIVYINMNGTCKYIWYTHMQIYLNIWVHMQTCKLYRGCLLFFNITVFMYEQMFACSSLHVHTCISTYVCMCAHYRNVRWFRSWTQWHICRMVHRTLIIQPLRCGRCTGCWLVSVLNSRCWS